MALKKRRQESRVKGNGPRDPKLTEVFGPEETKKEVGHDTVSEATLIELKNKFNFKLIEDKSINDFLIAESNNLYSNEVNSDLISGEILTKVFNRLSGTNQHDSLYGEWLRAIDYNARTALRHRLRYGYYSASKNAKEFFATLPIKLLAELHTYNRKEEILKDIEEGKITNKQGLKMILVEKLELDDPANTIVVSEETAEKYNKLKDSVKYISKEIERIDLAKLKQEGKLGKFDKMLKKDLQELENIQNRLTELVG